MATLRAGMVLDIGLAITGLSVGAFWGALLRPGRWPYPQALLAYLEGDSDWTALEHDVAAQALNEYCAAMGLGYPVAYVHEL